MERQPIYPQHHINREEMMSKKRAASSEQQSNPPIPPSSKGGLGGIANSELRTPNFLRKLFTIHYSLFTNKKGVTLVELMITMVIFVLVIAAASQIFTGLLTQFKQQSKIAETNIEGIIGLEIMRRDIAHAGYGLPWVIDAAVAYNEAAAGYNDCAGTAPCNPPRAILSGNGAGVVNGSDELIVKATNIARNGAAQAWTRLGVWNTKRNGLSGESFDNSDRVIVLSPGTTDANRRSLVVSGNFYAIYNATAAFAPTDATETFFVYGINRGSDSPVPWTPRMPFNRADYYISTSNVPSQCAAGTGVLSKNVISHTDGSRADNLPLLDCVADLQVNFWLDTNADGNIDWPPSDNIGTGGLNLTAQQIREQLKEVRVYVVAHEGQRDINYDFSMNNTREFLSALEVLGGTSRTIEFINLKTLVGDPDYKYYRWKVYTIVVKPSNLR